jgi:ParB-like nuclease domain
MLDWLKIANLRIDDRYQRPLTARNWKAIHDIAANFDWCAFGPILCAPIEGGLYAVIDGQHRAHAAALCGIERIPAMIVPVPPAKQALAFVSVNSGIRVSPHQTFRAELAAASAEAVAIAEACRAAGCEALTYNPSAATKKPRQIASIGFLRACIRRGEAQALTVALSAIVAYDEKGRSGLYTDYILVPWVAAVLQSGVTDVAILTDALRRRDPFHAIESATNFARLNVTAAPVEKRRTLLRQIEAAA